MSKSKLFANISFDFSERRALVVGGSGGIGRATAEAFIKSGATTFCAARNPPVGLDGAEFIKTDLRQERDIERLFSVLEEQGGIDFVVNLAAVNHCKPAEEISTNEWNEVLDVNLRGIFLVCQHAARLMKKSGYGRIVNVSSVAGRHRSPVSGVHYVSSKAGLIGLSRQLSFELAPYGITVNATCPSQTMTDMLRQSMSDKQISDLERGIPIGRIAQPVEQVGPILFLCSEAAGYITGSVLDVNGGQL